MDESFDEVVDWDSGVRWTTGVEEFVVGEGIKSLWVIYKQKLFLSWFFDGHVDFLN